MPQLRRLPAQPVIQVTNNRNDISPSDVSMAHTTSYTSNASARARTHTSNAYTHCFTSPHPPSPHLTSTHLTSPACTSPHRPARHCTAHIACMRYTTHRIASHGRDPPHRTHAPLQQQKRTGGRARRRASPCPRRPTGRPARRTPAGRHARGVGRRARRVSTADAPQRNGATHATARPAAPRSTRHPHTFASRPDGEARAAAVPVNARAARAETTRRPPRPASITTG